jgi:adenylate cyclase
MTIETPGPATIMAVGEAMPSDAARRGRTPRVADTPHESFHRLLAREVLSSERRRVFSLAGLLTAIFLTMLLLVAVAPGFIETIFHGPIPVGIPLTVFPPFIIYEVAVAGLLTFQASRGRTFPIYGRFANVAIETSLPTLLIYLLAQHVTPSAAFTAWPSLLYFLFIILSTLRLDFALSVLTGAVAALELFVLASLEFHLAWRATDIDHSITYHLTRSLVLLAGGILAGTVGVTIKRYFARALAAASARDRVTNLFGQHVSPQVVDRLLVMGQAELSEMRRVCVMFFDIRGFTAAARTRTPAEVVARLDEVFAALVEIVDRHHGIVNKFLGDGFLAMFGAPIDDPDAARHSVAAGYEMLRAVAAGNAGSQWPIRIGIGIHIGEAVTGTVGSPRRKEYTVIGDTVNLASRLESLNKEVGSQFIISDAVHEAAGGTADAAEPLGPIAVRGYAEPVMAWRLA